MDSELKWKVAISDDKDRKKSKFVEFDSLAEAEKFFWNILKIDFLRNAVVHMTIFQVDDRGEHSWILNFSDKEFVVTNKEWLKKPYDKEVMRINSHGDVVESNAWKKSEYEFAVEHADNQDTKEELLKSMKGRGGKNKK